MDDLCGERNPDLPHYCTLAKDHGGDYHIATVGPAEWGNRKAPELSRWPVSPIDFSEEERRLRERYGYPKYPKEE